MMIYIFLFFIEGRAVNISKFLYTCILSAFITAPLIFLQRFIDKSDFPIAVGPVKNKCSLSIIDKLNCYPISFIISNYF